MIAPERIARIRAVSKEWSNRAAAELANELLDEIDRLRAVIRETHYDCMGMGPDRHLPGCKLYEIEP